MKTVEIRFNAPAHHSLEVEGQTIRGGQSGRVNEATAQRLRAGRETNITILDEPTPAPVERPKKSRRAAGGADAKTTTRNKEES